MNSCLFKIISFLKCPNVKHSFLPRSHCQTVKHFLELQEGFRPSELGESQGKSPAVMRNIIYKYIYIYPTWSPWAPVQPAGPGRPLSPRVPLYPSTPGIPGPPAAPG